ncbi:MAG: hypothetical protein ACREQL_16485 [Candidatus Binatia bacterium]
MTPTEQGYLDFLCARDGTANLARHTLSRREALFERLERHPVRSSAQIDADVFARNLARRRPEPGLDDRMLWLLATAKANQAERFGVGLGELYGVLDVTDPVRVHITLQEVYHTRILADVVAIFGLTVAPKPPPLAVRSFVRLLIALPERRQLPLTGAAEMAGCVIFRALRDRGIALFADEPAVAERIRLLYDEILADEIGHVGYIASRLGPAGRFVARTLHRLLGSSPAGAMPELVRLFGRRELRRRFAAAFRVEEMARELGGLAYAAAAM